MWRFPIYSLKRQMRYRKLKKQCRECYRSRKLMKVPYCRHTPERQAIIARLEVRCVPVYVDPAYRPQR